jgi:uncharacterized Ntn-hydrolase superfamily protein
VTFSIVALDARTGRAGVAVASCVLAVGTRVPSVRAGAGVVVVQAGAPVGLGRELLTELEGGSAPDTLVEQFAASEPHASAQVAVLRVDGRFAVFTGSECEPYAGHATGHFVSAQGNLLVDARVPQAMVDAYRDAEGRFEARLVAALRAGQARGGDARSTARSAALLVVPGDSGARRSGRAGDPFVDLRVDDDPDAVGALDRLVVKHEAHEHVLRESEPDRNDEERADDVRVAYRLAPDDPIVRAAAVVRLSAAGARDEADPIIADIVRAGDGPALAARLRRRADAGLEREDANFLWLLRRLDRRQ